MDEPYPCEQMEITVLLGWHDGSVLSFYRPVHSQGESDLLYPFYLCRRRVGLRELRLQRDLPHRRDVRVSYRICQMH